MSPPRLLPQRSVDELIQRRRAAIPPEAREAAEQIVDAVRRDGESALRRYAERFGELAPNEPIVIARAQLEQALHELDRADRERLERVAGRIRTFAQAQRDSLRELTITIPGGKAGHTIAPVRRAGCYAPGGRYPLPSSVLMTVVTARAAGVREVWVASPKPTPLVLAAAAVAGADGLFPVGGAQAIAALAYGAGSVPRCDVVVGPGNHYVTAAKRLVAGDVGIDLLAGPSELVVFADPNASDPAIIAADLLAQAEHDPYALPIFVAVGDSLTAQVEVELERQLSDLPTAEIARAALANSGVIIVDTVETGIRVCDALAPEHLELHLVNGGAVAPRLANYGALFIGSSTGEVLGDYGIGPNHVLPTGGTARWTGGLSVLTFLRVRTWVQIDDASATREVMEDAAWFGRAEGLEAHARAAELRAKECPMIIDH
jgi:phosphoribosyl-ATP pyrophosphohydrolase/phosphoribosyl-AMP cyclohydrolase/histidinol dehydrogenase